MTTSDENSFPSRLTKIDELTIGDHTFLEAGDVCLFFGEYSARRNWSHSPTNKLVLNFKKPSRLRNTNQWQYKVQAIQQVSYLFSKNIGSSLAKITLVPVPPSKLKADPEYDDRIMDMLRGLVAPEGATPDVRELVLQTRDMPASHGSSARLPPSEWEEAYAINEELTEVTPTWIGIVDDLLVTGCRFRAMSNVLKKRFPEAKITGLFIARRVPEAVDISEFFGNQDV